MFDELEWTVRVEHTDRVRWDYFTYVTVLAGDPVEAQLVAAQMVMAIRIDTIGGFATGTRVVDCVA